ncbi:hypothetical protein ACHHYP_16307 [Achlya hypogyna]|uniref:Uncharacterized protein n=1 Tax=Achlya hypogyna TaxID=1202772 RepID=A0A1V9Y991_ACHHY|nr:hypothetical protein ACHHYP_16307 [Achlya hypogyna]
MTHLNLIVQGIEQQKKEQHRIALTEKMTFMSWRQTKKLVEDYARQNMKKVKQAPRQLVKFSSFHVAAPNAKSASAKALVRLVQQVFKGYLTRLRDINPGTVTAFDRHPNGVFSRAMFVLGVIASASHHNQLICSVDGGHMKGSNYKGVQRLLVGRDGNFSNVTIAVALNFKIAFCRHNCGDLTFKEVDQESLEGLELLALALLDVQCTALQEDGNSTHDEVRSSCRAVGDLTSHDIPTTGERQVALNLLKKAEILKERTSLATP